MGISLQRLPLGSGVYHFCPISLPKASHMAKTNSKEPGEMQSSCREMGERGYRQGTSGICFTEKSKFTLVLPMKFSIMARAEARVQGPQKSISHFLALWEWAQKSLPSSQASLVRICLWLGHISTTPFIHHSSFPVIDPPTFIGSFLFGRH